MSSLRRFTMPVVTLLAATMLVACGTQSAPSVAPSASAAAPVPSVDTDARDAFNAAICPLFTGILEIDPRLAALRGVGAEGGDMTAQAKQIGAVEDELGLLLNDLEAVPEWSSGADLRYHLITALHGIRARLLRIGGDPGAGTSADELANLPFIATEAMDIAMQDAIGGGLSCEDAP